jgi:hypothetical protein
MKRDARPQSLPFVTFRVPSKGASPPGSPHRAPTERDALFTEPPFNYLSEFPVNGPTTILDRDSVEKGARHQSLLKSLVDDPPAKFPSRAHTESDVRPLSPPRRILPYPQERSPPPPGSSNRAPAERDAPFLEPFNYLLKFAVNGLPPPQRRETPVSRAFFFTFLSNSPFPQSPW